MSEPPFRIGDWVVCVDESMTGGQLIEGEPYQVSSVELSGDTWWISPFRSHQRAEWKASRFVHMQDTPCPSLADDYPDSTDDYAHNKPHHVIVWGAASLLIWMAFFAGLLIGWRYL